MDSFRLKAGGPVMEFWHSGLPLLICWLALHVLTAYSLLSSFLPSLLTNYFANMGSGIKVDCSGDDKSSEKCQSATNETLLWKCGMDIIINFVFGIFLSPTLGSWSDLLGRKPFILLGCAVGVLPCIVLIFHLKLDLPLWWYFIAKIIVQPLTPLTPAFSTVADLISPRNRTVAYALMGITFPIAFMIGPMLVGTGAVPGPLVAAFVCLGTGTLSFVGVLIFFTETLSANCMESAKLRIFENKNTPYRWFHSLVKRPLGLFRNSISVLYRSKVFVKLTICIFVLYINFEEVNDMQAIYFQEVAGFGPKDIATLFTVVGVSSWVLLSLGLWLLIRILKMTDKHLLIFGMCMFALQQMLYAFVRTKAIIYAVAAVGTSANLVLPAINGIKSTLVRSDEQGALQGAVKSAMSLGSSFGPALFLFFFYFFRSGNLYLPGAPFFVGSLLLLVSVVIAFTLELPRSRLQISGFGSEELEPLCLDNESKVKPFPITISSDEEG